MTPPKCCGDLGKKLLVVNMEICKHWGVTLKMMVKPVASEECTSSSAAGIGVHVSSGLLKKKGALAMENLQKGMSPLDVFIKVSREPCLR